MDKEKRRLLFSAFLAIIIIGSVISLAFNPRFTTPKKEKPKETVKPAIKAYKAEDIEAEIEQLTSTYVLYGKTTIANPYELTSKLKALPSVREIYNAKYIGTKNGKLEFMCDLLLESDYNTESLLAQIQEQKLLEDAALYVKAMLKVKQNISLQALNDLNKRKDINLDVPFVVGIVGIESKPGDKLRVALYLQLQGKAIVKGSAIAYEKENLSLKPRFFTQDVNASIVELEPKFIIAEQFSYDGFDLNELKQKLMLSDVNNTELKVYTKSSFYVEVDLSDYKDENKERLKEDLNKELSSLENVSDISFEEDANKLKINITMDSSKPEHYAKLRKAIDALLKEKELSYSISNANAFFSAKIELEEALAGESAKELADSIKEILSAYGIDAKVAQGAYLKIESLQDTDNNVSVEVKEKVKASVLAGHNIGDTITASVNFSLIREKIGYIEATELALLS